MKFLWKGSGIVTSGIIPSALSQGCFEEKI